MDSEKINIYSNDKIRENYNIIFVEIKEYDIIEQKTTKKKKNKIINK
jgi:hypothetical protein